VSNERPETTNKRIALVSDCNSLHSTLLAKFIEASTCTSCELIGQGNPLPDNIDLVLVDCLLSNLDELNQLLSGLSAAQEHRSTALINAEHKSEHEDLLDWPCISGLFYIDSSEDQLLRGLEQLLSGDYWVPRRLLHHFFNKHRQNKEKRATDKSVIQLTNREKEILVMIKEGMSNSAVSNSLDLSEHTVKSHLYNIYKKIGVRNRMEAGNWARNQQSIDFQ